MAPNTKIATPFPLMIQRLQHQMLPVLVVLVCAMLAAWLWTRQNRTAFATGEVSAVRVNIESKYDGILQELPQPVRLFDTVRAGQVVARVDSSAAESELRRLEQEFAAMQAAPTTAPSGGANGSAAAWYQARMDELRARIENRDLKSSIAGMVVKIEVQPGESARVGKPIVTIASDRSEFIVGYLRQDHPLRPEVGMDVELRSRSHPAATYNSHVQSVGAQVELMPARHWRNPQVSEWGLPVQIAMPTDLSLKPGELIDLVLRPTNQ